MPLAECASALLSRISKLYSVERETKKISVQHETISEVRLNILMQPYVLPLASCSDAPDVLVPLSRRPMRLAEGRTNSTQTRLEIMRRYVTQLIREERVEWPSHYVLEVRPYVERVKFMQRKSVDERLSMQLLQLAITEGWNDPYTAEMCSWWVLERDLLHKLFDVSRCGQMLKFTFSFQVLVPRYEKEYLGLDFSGPFTRIYPLPSVYAHRERARPQGDTYLHREMTLLELKGLL